MQYITSGDRLVDWIFNRFIEIANKAPIRKKKRLLDPDDPRKKTALSGLVTKQNDIYLNSAKIRHKNKDELLKTFIHELAHILFFPKIKHRYIYSITTILLLKFSDKQKRILKSYIPKHEVKKNPK